MNASKSSLLASSTTFAELPVDQLYIDQEIGPIRSDLLDEAASMQESIEKYGLLEPLIVHETEANRYAIIDGHRRFQALKNLGYTVIPCLVRENLSLGKQLTLRYMLNNTYRLLTQIEMKQLKSRLENAGLAFRMR